MQEQPPELRTSQAATPANFSWVYTMLSEGMVFPPPDPTQDPLEREEAARLDAFPITSLIVIALLLVLLIAG